MKLGNEKLKLKLRDIKTKILSHKICLITQEPFSFSLTVNLWKIVEILCKIKLNYIGITVLKHQLRLVV